MTKLDELKEINRADFKASYKYVEKVTLFYSSFKTRLCFFLGSDDPRTVAYWNLDGKPSEIFQDAAYIDNDGYFSCLFLIRVNNERMDYLDHNYGRSFSEKRLKPISGIVLNISIAHSDKVFRVKAPSVENGELKDIELQIAENAEYKDCEDLLNNCFEAAKLIAMQDLSYRIKRLPNPKQSEQSRCFGCAL